MPPQARLRELLGYDQRSGILVWKTRAVTDFIDQRAARIWNTRFSGEPFGHVGKNGYRYGAIDYVHYLSHRIAWKWMTGEEPPEIDHRDGDPHNNAWANLRATDRRGNARNQAKHIDRQCPYKGIKQQYSGRWMARIRADKCEVYLGTFDTPEQAHGAYAEASRRLHGEFGSTA